MVSSSVGRGEEAVDPRGLRGTEGRVDEVDKEEAEEEAEEEALLPCRGVKCNVLCILHR